MFMCYAYSFDPVSRQWGWQRLWCGQRYRLDLLLFLLVVFHLIVKKNTEQGETYPEEIHFRHGIVQDENGKDDHHETLGTTGNGIAKGRKARDHRECENVVEKIQKTIQ